MTMGERIKELRRERKMTLEELARKIGVSKPTMQRYESGVITMTTDRVLQIADALDVDPNYLMGWNARSAPAEPELPDSVIQIINRLRLLSDEDLQEALRYIDYIASHSKT